MQNNSNSQTHQVYIVHNPVAGTSDPDYVRTILENKLDEKGWGYQIYETTGQEIVRELVKDAVQQGFNTVWAAGGDGTVSGVLNGLVKSDIPLGIIPIGTGNALARDLGIPIDVESAVDLLLNDYRIRRLDVLQVEKDYFVLAVSVGITALTMVETPRSQKRRFGRMAYILNGFRKFLSNSLWPFQVSIDGQLHIVRASEVIAANAGIIGIETFRWGSHVRPDDGEANLCFARVESLNGFFALLGGLLFDRQDQVAEVACKAAQKTIEIRSRRRMPVQGDGEPIGYTPILIKVIPSSLSVVAPYRKE